MKLVRIAGFCLIAVALIMAYVIWIFAGVGGWPVAGGQPVPAWQIILLDPYFFVPLVAGVVLVVVGKSGQRKKSRHRRKT